MSMFSNTNKLAFLLCLCLLNILICQDTTANLDDISVQALGKSGKIRIIKTLTSNNKTETNEVTFDFSSLREVDINGTAVGTSGQEKHSFNNFAQLDFKTSAVNNIIYQNLTALSFELTATNIQIPSTTFTGRIFIFNQTGVIKNNNETANVEPGTVKINVEIKDWYFCLADGCAGTIPYNCCKKGNEIEQGYSLQFALAVKGRDSASQKSKNLYSLGGSEMILFENVLADDAWNVMSPITYNDKTLEYTFSFPKFSKSLVYDPLIRYEKPASSSSIIIIGIVVVVIIAVVVTALIMKRKTQAKDSLIV